MRDLRDVRTPVSAEELEQFETDALVGFVLARASAGLTDGTIRGDVGHLEQVRTWFGSHTGRRSPKRSGNRSRGLPLLRVPRIGYTGCLAPEPTAQYR